MLLDVGGSGRVQRAASTESTLAGAMDLDVAITSKDLSCKADYQRTLAQAHIPANFDARVGGPG